MTQSHIDLTTIVVLAIAAVAAYLGYRDPRFGAALLVGIAVIGALLLLLGH